MSSTVEPILTGPPSITRSTTGEKQDLKRDENIEKINLKSAKKILKSESLITIPNEKNKDSPGFDEIIENDFEDDEPPFSTGNSNVKEDDDDDIFGDDPVDIMAPPVMGKKITGVDTGRDEDGHEEIVEKDMDLLDGPDFTPTKKEFDPLMNMPGPPRAMSKKVTGVVGVTNVSDHEEEFERSDSDEPAFILPSDKKAVPG